MTQFKKVDFNMVTLYTIHVTRSDSTGYFAHYLDEVMASQKFWKAVKEEGYVEVTIKKEPYLIADLPEEVRKRVHAERIAREHEIAEQKNAQVEPQEAAAN